MKKQTLLALALLAGTSLAQAEGNKRPSVDENLAIGAASILGTGIRHTGPAGNEKPSVDKNLAIGAASVLGTGIRLPNPVNNTTADVVKTPSL